MCVLCMYLYIYIYTYVYIFLNMHIICMYLNTHIFIYTYIYICMYVYMYTYNKVIHVVVVQLLSRMILRGSFLRWPIPPQWLQDLQNAMHSPELENFLESMGISTDDVWSRAWDHHLRLEKWGVLTAGKMYGIHRQERCHDVVDCVIFSSPSAWDGRMLGRPAGFFWWVKAHMFSLRVAQCSAFYPANAFLENGKVYKKQREVIYIVHMEYVTYLYIYIFLYIYIYMCMYIYIYIHTYVFIYACVLVSDIIFID